MACCGLQCPLAAFGELEVYNSRVEPVGKLHFDIASLDKAIIRTEIIIFRESALAALVVKPSQEGNLDLG